MTRDKDFERQLANLRPKLHRYCARMTGSAIDGEDVVQEVLVRALRARSGGSEIDNFEGWLFRVAHNASLDFLRARTRTNTVQLADVAEAAAHEAAPTDAATVGFRTFLQLPVLQRCAVVLKDVLGHSIAEIAKIADCSSPAAKSALQRGRARLRELAAGGEDEVRLPFVANHDRQRLFAYVNFFRAGDFDSIRRMLADEVSLDLVNTLQLEGRDEVSPYFTRYAELPHWRYAAGEVDGRPAMLVYHADDQRRPSHFAILTWTGETIIRIRDFLFAPYVMEGADWVRLD